MGQSTPIRTNDEAGVADPIGWARISGMVEIHPNGSWNLTPQGVVGMLGLFGQVRPLHMRSATAGRPQQYAI